jgi:hypothetical protein
MEEAKEVEENRVEQVLVAQPSAAAELCGFLHSRKFTHYRGSKTHTAPPRRMAVLRELSESFVGRGFSRDIQKATFAAFRP